jgi:hypothetical protein
MIHPWSSPPPYLLWRTCTTGKYYFLNLSSQDYSTQKGWFKDLGEGKFSYLIAHCVQASPSCRGRIIWIFRGKMAMPDLRLSIDSKLLILKCLKETSTFEAAWNLLDQLEGEIEAEIVKLRMMGGSNPMMNLLPKRLSVRNKKRNPVLEQ